MLDRAPGHALLETKTRFGARRALRSAVLCVLMLFAFLTGCSDAPDTFQGYAEGDFVYMASSQPGQLEHLHVARGEHVATGAALFELERGQELALTAQREADLKSSEALLNDMRTGQRPLELDVTRAQLEQARAIAHDSALMLKREEALYAQGGIARARLDNSRAIAESDSARVDELQSQLGVGKLPGREERIKAQEALLEASRAALAQAQWLLEQKQVVTYQAGLVYDTLYREGEWVPAGSPVVRLLPPQNIYLRFFVPQTALARLQVNQKIVIHIDGAPDVPASITFISPEAEYTPPVIFSNETRSKLVYLIEAYPAPEDAARLHPGQPVSVSVP